MAATAKFADAFNAWMYEYTHNPEEFAKIEYDALKFLREKLDGKEPSYGELAAETFKQYLDKV
ncbi:hypothetical protein D3C85_488150 [compost metagenome]